MAANVNNYISAGQAAVNSAVKSRKALARNKPRFDELGTEAIKQAGLENEAAFAANAKASKAGMNAMAEVQDTRNDADAAKEIQGIKKGARKAGMLAGGAALLGVGAIQMNKKDEPDEMLALYKGQLDKYGNKIGEADSAITEAQAHLDSFKNKPKPSDTTDTTSTVSTGNVDASDGWKRLSKVIAFGEGTDNENGYTTQFTGTQFSDTSRHPRQIRSSGNLSSDAAGKYQFLSTTWDGAKKALGLKDFSPASQEKAGRYLTKNRGVNPDAVYSTKEEFKAAIDKLSPEWASLPTAKTGTSHYGQGGKSLDELWARYNQ